MSTKVEAKPSLWKTNQKKYAAVHQWLRRMYGYPQRCDNPFCLGRSDRYEWANLTGKYLRDLSDWKRLCASCHRIMDNNNMCHAGHEMNSETTYITPANGKRSCRICKNITMKTYNSIRYPKHALKLIDMVLEK